MRTIEFRGKRIDNGEWVEGDYLRERNDRPNKLNACIVQTHRSFDVDPETVEIKTDNKEFVNVNLVKILKQ